MGETIYEYIFRVRIKEDVEVGYKEWLIHWKDKWDEALYCTLDHINAFSQKDYVWPKGFVSWAMKRMQSDYVFFEKCVNLPEQSQENFQEAC